MGFRATPLPTSRLLTFGKIICLYLQYREHEQTMQKSSVHRSVIATAIVQGHVVGPPPNHRQENSGFGI